MRLVQQKYYTASGEAKVNCYKLTISKKHLEEAGIDEKDDLEVYTEGNKIIIRKKKKQYEKTTFTSNFTNSVRIKRSKSRRNQIYGNIRIRD